MTSICGTRSPELGGRDAGAEPGEPISEECSERVSLVERGSRDLGWTRRGRGLLAELRDPAFCFLLVVRVCRRSQIVAQFRDYLIGLTFCKVNLREHQTGVRKCIFTLTKHFDGLWSDTALGEQSAAEHVV